MSVSIPRSLALSDQVVAALGEPVDVSSALGLTTMVPADGADGLRALAAIYDLALAPLDVVGGAVAWQHDLQLVALRCRLERAYEQALDAWSVEVLDALPPGTRSDPVATVRALSTMDRVPAVYDWLAERATMAEIAEFVSLEGGPDDGFDDLVAICQIGLPAQAKLELARNYWDELGNGDAAAVHRELHRRLIVAMDISPAPRETLSDSALARSVLGGFLATNRRLQPEMVGALGMIELQAGPRCRRVARALERVGAPLDAVPFYDEHAVADPRHGKDWLDNAIVPLVAGGWGAAIVRGAAWRAAINRRFFADLAVRFEI